MRPTIKIGLVAPFEGRYRYVGYDVIYAVRMALREVNEAGGVGGYNVELVAYDDRADPAMAVEQARKLAVDSDVIAVIGHFREETTAAALSVYTTENIPLIAPAALDPAITGGKGDTYRLGPSAGALVDEWLRYLDESNANRAVLVTDGGPLGRTLPSRTQIRTMSLADAGWLEEALASEVVLCDAAPVTAGEIVSALRAAGWEGDFLGGPALTATDFTAVAGSAAEGVSFVTPWPFPADAPDGEGFSAAYREIANGLSPGPLALPAYEAAWILLEALERSIATDGRLDLEATDRESLLGHVAFDESHNWDEAPLYWYRLGPRGEPTRLR